MESLSSGVVRPVAFLTAFFLFAPIPSAQGVENGASPTLVELYQQAIASDLNNSENAAALYKKVAERRNENPELGAKADLRLGYLFERLNQSDAAIQAYRDVTTQNPPAPVELTQVAQVNLDRLGGRLEKQHALDLAAVASRLKPESENQANWLFSTDFAMSHPSPRTVGLKNDEMFSWFSVSREKGHFRTGLEGAYSWGGTVTSLNYSQTLPSGTGNYQYTDSNNDTTHTAYVGPFVQLRNRWKLFSYYVQLGTGILIRKTHPTKTDDYLFADGSRTSFTYDPSDSSYSRVNAAFPLAVGVDVTIFERIELGLGLRDVMTVTHREQTQYGEDADDHSALFFAHWMMPFLRVSYRFGGSHS